MRKSFGISILPEGNTYYVSLIRLLFEDTAHFCKVISTLLFILLINKPFNMLFYVTIYFLFELFTISFFNFAYIYSNPFLFHLPYLYPDRFGKGHRNHLPFLYLVYSFIEKGDSPILKD